MEQPVRVSLVFPRSGQQLYVLVPKYVAWEASMKERDIHLGVAERDDRSGGDGAGSDRRAG